MRLTWKNTQRKKTPIKQIMDLKKKAIQTMDHLSHHLLIEYQDLLLSHQQC